MPVRHRASVCAVTARVYVAASSDELDRARLAMDAVRREGWGLCCDRCPKEMATRRGRDRRGRAGHPARVAAMTAAARASSALHSMASPEWYTPAPFVEAAREVMGGIDLDPASCAQANETVRAATFYDQAADGLSQPWAGRVFLNPPGGRGLVRAFWERLITHWRDGRVSQAIWIGYSLEQLQTLQSCPLGSPLDFELCFTSRRISFEAPGGGKRSPTHSNFIAYLPGDPLDNVRFEAAFERFGKVRK